jgi:hypothetical protein
LFGLPYPQLFGDNRYEAKNLKSSGIEVVGAMP